MPDPATFLDHYATAIASLRPGTLLALYAEDARVFDAMVPEEYADRAAWAGMVVDWFAGMRSASASVRDTQVVRAGDLAVLTGHLTQTCVLVDGTRTTLRSRLTMVVRRFGEDDWRIVHEHTSVPLDMGDAEARPGVAQRSTTS